MLKISSGILAVFLILLGLEFNGLFTALDPAISKWLQMVIPRVFDVPLSFFSLVGSFEITAGIIGVWALIYWKKTKKVPWGLGFFVLLMVIELFGKTVLVHPGPPADFFRTTLPFYLPTSNVETNGSFPSGHVSRTVFLVTIGFFWAGRHRIVFAFCLLTFAFIMAISRIYLGEHWTSDVIGGLLLGSSMGMMAVRFL